MKKAKYYSVMYRTEIGVIKSMIVKGMNQNEALKNAANIRFTGKDFSILMEVGKTNNTAKGSGIAIGR